MRARQLLILTTLGLTACGARTAMRGFSDAGSATDGQPADTTVDGPGSDSAAQTCVSNNDCSPAQFCKLPSCGANALGICTLRPPALCTDDGPPICGCDGQTYGCEEAVWSAGMNVAHIGACQTNCSELEKQYAAAIDQAKQCCPFCGAIDLCGQGDWYPSALICGCKTSVNPNNATEIALLDKLLADSAALACGADIDCAPCPPPPPSPAFCSPQPNGDGACFP